MKYFIKTFGCQQNKADSERIASAFKARGMKSARGYKDADYVVINTCMIRESAENRVYGLVHNLGDLKIKNSKLKIVVTGCMVGLAYRDKTGKYLKRIREIMPEVDEFMPIEEVGFDSEPVRQNQTNAWVPISNGCNNFCTFCVVPFTRGREISRPYKDIIEECFHLKARGYESVTLLGQNVNSYGVDLLLPPSVIPNEVRDLANKGSVKKTYFSNNETMKQLNNVKPIYVKHLGRYRIPTLFPFLLERIAKMGFKKVDFMSSNPWDFSAELIEHFRGQKEKLRHKYREELHANEVAILPYYVANLNIEATYAAIMDGYEAARLILRCEGHLRRLPVGGDLVQVVRNFVRNFIFGSFFGSFFFASFNCRFVNHIVVS